MSSSPITRLRHIEVAVRHGADAARTFSDILGIPRDVNDSPGIPLDQKRTAPVGEGHTNLKVNGLRAGDTFIEMISPTYSTAAVGRFIEREGEGLYFITLQIKEDRDELARTLLHRRVLLSGTLEYPPAYRAIWVHPKSGTGTILELGEVTDPEQVWAGGGDWGWENTPYEGDLRQVRQGVMVVKDLDRSLSLWERYFDLQPSWRDQDDQRRWAVLPFADGDTFLELRQPLRADTAESAFVERRGEGLYTVIAEASNLDAIRERVAERGGLQPADIDHEGYEGFVIDPELLLGARFEVGRPTGENPWPPSGPSS